MNWEKVWNDLCLLFVLLAFGISIVLAVGAFLKTIVVVLSWVVR